MYKRNRCFSYVLTSLVVFTGSVSSEGLNETVRSLARCSGVLPYSVNLHLMSNNSGAAKSMLLQSSKVVVALFARSFENDSLPGWKILEFDRLTDNLPQYFAKHPERLAGEIDVCNVLANKVLSEEIRKGTKIEGKNIFELVNYIHEGQAKLLGI